MGNWVALGSAGASGSMVGEGAGATGDCSVGVATDAGETGAEDTASTATKKNGRKNTVLEENGERLTCFFWVRRKT